MNPNLGKKSHFSKRVNPTTKKSAFTKMSHFMEKILTTGKTHSTGRANPHMKRNLSMRENHIRKNGNILKNLTMKKVPHPARNALPRVSALVAQVVQAKKIRMELAPIGQTISP
jgi:hypothetical protein